MSFAKKYVIYPLKNTSFMNDLNGFNFLKIKIQKVEISIKYSTSAADKRYVKTFSNFCDFIGSRLLL